MVSGEDDWAVWLDQCFVPRICPRTRGSGRLCLPSLWRQAHTGRPLLARTIASDPGALVVLDLGPTHIHRLFQLFAVTWMQPFDRFAALVQFLLHRQLAEGRVRLIRVPANQHASVAEKAGRRKPDRTASCGYKLEAAIDVIVLLPESPALPCNLVGARIGAFINHLLVRNA